MTQSRIIFSAAMRRLTPPLLVWAVTAANLVHAQVGLGDPSPAVQYSTELRANETLNECLVRLKITDVGLYRAIEHIDIVDDIQITRKGEIFRKGWAFLELHANILRDVYDIL
jgi:hypothetical protein